MWFILILMLYITTMIVPLTIIKWLLPWSPFLAVALAFSSSSQYGGVGCAHGWQALHWSPAHTHLVHTRTRVRSFELMRRMQMPFFLFDYSVCRSLEERKKEKNALISNSVKTWARINPVASVHRVAPCLSSYSLSFALCSLMRRLEWWIGD